jgi:hypothetical protein
MNEIDTVVSGREPGHGDRRRVLLNTLSVMQMKLANIGQ